MEDPDHAAHFQDRLALSRDNVADMGLLLEAYRPYLLGIANGEIDSELRGKAGASDLVQQTFLEANNDLARFQGTTEAELIAWLRRILINNVANFRRQFHTNGKRDVKRDVPIDSVGSFLIPADEPSPSKQVVAREEADAVEQALAHLPDDYRKAIVMRHQEHCSFAEIGAALGRSTGAARKLWVRAVEALQAALAASS